ncbi:MAG TPA: phosphopyruvate hydratase [Candidatus Acidoferrales bacterium]|nr:phosphopyruvate hydratase [Candidatus Acidoferrales bacterium]
MSEIAKLEALEILDSRGNPTLAVTVTLVNGIKATAKVPSGASTGKREAVELRDADKSRYGGKGVLKAKGHVEGEIQSALLGFDADDQKGLDHKLCELDGTRNKGRLGANAILGVSLAVARAAAKDRGLPLYASLVDESANLLPAPGLNVLNGGRHSDNNVDFQEFMISPVGAPSFSEGLRAAAETFQTLRSVLHKKGYSTAVGDEGGFAPQLKSNEEPIELILEAIQKAGYAPGRDIVIMLDPAASEFFNDGVYSFGKSNQGGRTSQQMVELYKKWLKQYPEIWSLEDGMAEDDQWGWQLLTQEVGNQIQLVGDDNFVTNPALFQKGIKDGIANAILIKLNQIGTVTETLDCIHMARENGYGAVISHRSGETDDTSIADLAVAAGMGQIKTGSACRGERIVKYNRLLEIERELGSRARYAGSGIYDRWKKAVQA